MNITHTGLGMDVTEAIKEFTDDKMTKLERHMDSISRINVTYNVVKLDNIAEATVHLGGAEFHARAKSDDMYGAIEGLVSKLDRQLLKHKEKHNDHRD